MYFGNNARTLNKLYKIIKGSQKGYKKWLNEKVLPLTTNENDVYELSPQSAYEVARSTFPAYFENLKLQDWKDLEWHLLDRYNYSSTLTPPHLMKQETALVSGSFKHGENVSRQSRWQHPQ